jgi:hypothetical protein
VIKTTPFLLAHGFHPRKGVDITPTHSRNPAVEEYLEGMEEARGRAIEALEKSAADMKRYHDAHKGKVIEREIGDMVWLDGRNIKTLRPSKKLDAKKLGPFEIQKKIGSSSYQLKLPQQWSRVHPVFNEVLLSTYHPPSYPSQRPPTPPAAIDVEDHPEYEVEEIMQTRKRGRGMQFLVKWKGYDHTEDTWEPRRNLANAQDLIDEFYQRNPAAIREIKETSFVDAILPIQSDLLQQAVKGDKIAEYRSYLIPNVQRLWFCDNTSRLVTHMAEVSPGTTHQDRRPNGTFKRPYRYCYQRFYRVITPFRPTQEELLQFEPTGPVLIPYPMQGTILLWSMLRPDEVVKDTMDISHRRLYTPNHGIPLLESSPYPTIVDDAVSDAQL